MTTAPDDNEHGSRMSIRYNEDLDPNEGPSFAEFAILATLFAIILLLIPIGVFTFGWPVPVLAALLVIDLILLFLVSMTAVFLLRVFFADRRTGRGRTIGVARSTTKAPLVVRSADAVASEDPEARAVDAEAPEGASAAAPPEERA